MIRWTGLATWEFEFMIRWTGLATWEFEFIRRGAGAGCRPSGRFLAENVHKALPRSQSGHPPAKSARPNPRNVADLCSQASKEGWGGGESSLLTTYWSESTISS